MYACVYAYDAQLQRLPGATCESARGGGGERSSGAAGRDLGCCTPVNLLLSSQKCQSVPFPRSVKTHHFCSGPISVDPICPQPNPAHGGVSEADSGSSSSSGSSTPCASGARVGGSPTLIRQAHSGPPGLAVGCKCVCLSRSSDEARETHSPKTAMKATEKVYKRVYMNKHGNQAH